ncbi:MAG TPA: MFS transporter [Chloroflexota bacterium]
MRCIAGVSSTPRDAGADLRRAFRSLRQRNFRLFWFGQAISLIGTWMQITGQAWLVLQLTHSAFQLGLVGALQSMPVLLFSLVGGVFADRWPKRRLLFGTQSAAMIQACLLWTLVVSGAIQIWQVYLLALLLGFAYCLNTPVQQAFVVELVGRDDLTNAWALYSSLVNVARIVGPSLGGILIAVNGVSTLFLLNTLSFVAVLAGLLLMNSYELRARAPSWAREGTRPTTWQNLREGLSYVLTTPTMVWLIGVVGLVVFFGANFQVVLPLFATQVLHLGARGFGFLSAASGIGSIVAALLLAWSNMQPTSRRVLIGMLVFGVLEAAFAVSHIALLSLFLIAIVGGAEGVFATLAITMLQTIAPDHLRGRVTSVYIFVFNGSVPLGYVMVGWISSRYGPSKGLFILSLISLSVVAAGWIWRRAAGPNIAETAPTG